MSTIADRAQRLAEQRRPFVHATVVRAQEPTSARPGDAAVILSDGSIEGFVGGQCAESSVRVAALDTLRNGTSLLLRVLPDGAADFPEAPGAQVVVNPCLSGGAIEIFLRPVLPAPVVRVAGGTPIADAVATLAGFLGYEVTRDGSYEGATAVVLAGLGRGEPDGIRAALDAGVGYIALVASPRRGAQVLDGMGLTEAERARIQTPAGVWIGARTPPEIALSILTEVVRAIRLDGLAPAAHAAAAPTAAAHAAAAHAEDGHAGHADPAPADAPDAPRTAVDPICGMTVLITPDALHAGGQYFCGPGCLARYTGS
ncbi:MAG TPA: XdhC family protein [Actinoplanes sp.]|nr:XdhC family protein [Actinoplanes sp.]